MSSKFWFAGHWSHRATLLLSLMVALMPLFSHAQFIHIFEVQDADRAPKSDLFNPASYKYVSPAQLQKNHAAHLPSQNSSPKPSTSESSSGSRSTSSSLPTTAANSRQSVPPPTSTPSQRHNHHQHHNHNQPQADMVPEYRNIRPSLVAGNNSVNASYYPHHDLRMNEIPPTDSLITSTTAGNGNQQPQHQQHQHLHSQERTSRNDYSSSRAELDRNGQLMPTSRAPPSTAAPSVTTYMQPISRILANISANEIPEHSEMELRKQIRMAQRQQGPSQPQSEQQQQQPSENRYSRTTPLRVSAQNQRQYVVRVPAPFPTAPTNQSYTGLYQQLPPNLHGQIDPTRGYNPNVVQYQNQPQHQPQPQLQSTLGHQQRSRLSTLNNVLSAPTQSSPADQGIPSSLLNSFLQRQQQPQSPIQPQIQHRPQVVASQPQQQQHRPQQPQIQSQPPYATNIPTNTYPTQPPTSSSVNYQQQPTPVSHLQGQLGASAPTGRSINGVSNNAISLLQPPITNKESLTDEDIRMIEEHNRKVRLFLQQRQAELSAEQDRIRHQKVQEEAQAKAAQEAAARAVEQERYRRLRQDQEAAARAAAEQEQARRMKAEQEAAQRAAVEQERIRRLKAEQETAARVAAEQERARRIKAEQEAAQRAAAEQERIQRIRAEQEAAQRAAAEQERIRRLKAEQEAAIQAAEQERLHRLRQEQEAAIRAAAEQDRLRRIREEHEAAQRAAAEQDRLHKLRQEQEIAAEQDRIQRLRTEQEQIRRLREEQEAAQRAAANQEQMRRLRDEQEAAAKAAAEQERIRRLKVEQEAATRAAIDQERLRQLRAQQDAVTRLGDVDRERLQRLRADQEINAIRMRYQNGNQLQYSSNGSSNGLSYQPEPNLAAIDDHHQLSNSQPQSSGQSQQNNVGLVDAARYRAEKEALAEQERLLRFQASQQALAQQQANEQARLRRLREEAMYKAEDDRAARDAQERQIMRARQDQSRLIHDAREASTRSQNPTTTYTPYTEDPGLYRSNYTSTSPQSHYGSLNNVRSPEPQNPRNYDSTYNADALPNSRAIQPISNDYTARGRSAGNAYSNHSSADTLRSNRIAAAPAPAPAPQDSSATTQSPNYKAAKISLQELPPDLDSDGIPGVAGRDYPTLTSIPKTSFSCSRQPLNGYYADTETACQVVHMCQMGGVQDSFLCPNGTIWNQEKFACQWWYEVSCATAPSFYALNNNLYKGADGGVDGKPTQSQRNSNRT